VFRISSGNFLRILNPRSGRSRTQWFLNPRSLLWKR
jgi:hypothetical protein